MFYAPGFQCPPNTDYNGYHNYIDHALPIESPTLYGLHPNAEIGFLTAQSEFMFKIIFEMQPRDTGSAGLGGISREDKVYISFLTVELCNVVLVVISKITETFLKCI